MVWTSQKFFSHGLEHGSCSDEGEGILEKLRKQFLIVIKLQGSVRQSVMVLSTDLFLEFSSF